MYTLIRISRRTDAPVYTANTNQTLITRLTVAVKFHCLFEPSLDKKTPLNLGHVISRVQFIILESSSIVVYTEKYSWG